VNENYCKDLFKTGSIGFHIATAMTGSKSSALPLIRLIEVSAKVSSVYFKYINTPTPHLFHECFKNHQEKASKFMKNP